VRREDGGRPRTSDEHKRALKRARNKKYYWRKKEQSEAEVEVEATEMEVRFENRIVSFLFPKAFSWGKFKEDIEKNFGLSGISIELCFHNLLQLLHSPFLLLSNEGPEDENEEALLDG